MSIFDLHANVIADYRNFVRAFITVADDRVRGFLDRALDEEQRLWPEFLLQLSPSYDRVATVAELAAQGVLHEETARIFCTPDGRPFHLYRHQVEALEKAREGESYVVTSGTGSGKSLTYFLPIIDALMAAPGYGRQGGSPGGLPHECLGQLAGAGSGEAAGKLSATDGTPVSRDLCEVYRRNRRGGPW